MLHLILLCSLTDQTPYLKRGISSVTVLKRYAPSEFVNAVLCLIWFYLSIYYNLCYRLINLSVRYILYIPTGNGLFFLFEQLLCFSFGNIEIIECYDPVTGREARRHTDGLFWWQLCVWISLKQNSTLSFPCPVLLFQFLFSCLAIFTVILHAFTLVSLLHVDNSSVLPSISLFISFFSLHSPPTLSLTKCCGASAAGCLPICYITVPSASLKYCWARLASATLHSLLSYH